MKYITTACFVLFIFNSFSSEIWLDIHNMSAHSVTIYYKDINGLQDRIIGSDTLLRMTIQIPPELPWLSILLKKKENQTKQFVIPYYNYFKLSIYPEPPAPDIAKNKKKYRQRKDR